VSAAHPLRRLLRYAHPLRWRIRAAVLCSILNKLFDLAPPLLIGVAVDIVVARENSTLAGWGIEDLGVQLWVLAGITLVIWGLESVFEYAMALLWRNLAQTMQHDLRLDAYDHIQGLPVSFFEDRQSGDLLTALNEDVNQLERFLDHGAGQLVRIATTVLAIGTYFFVTAPTIAPFSFLPIPFVLWGSFRVQRRIAPRYARVRERAGELGGILGGNLGGIATIQSYTAEAHESERLRAASDRYREANRHAIRLSSAFSPLIRMVIVCGFIFTLVLGGEAVFAGTLDVSVYTVLVFLTQRLLWPLTDLGQVVDLYHRAMASTDRILDLLDVPRTIRDGDRALPPEEVRGALSLRSVDFSYSTGPPVLTDFSLEVPAGSTVALVGATGSGKSSIVKLLLRFHEPSAGEVLLDGTPVERFRLAELRRAIGFVSQDVFLFAGTVRENIVYGSFDAADRQVVRAAAMAEAHEFIGRLDQGYWTPIGERGVKLSGGQRQRLAIARAIVKDPPILILDEATSAVDNETEAAIQRSLQRICVGRTTLIIAHRLSTIRHADAIHVIDRGRIVESGTHEGLLARGGIYARLWRVQSGERAPEGAGDRGS